MNGHFWDCLTGRPADRLGGPPVLGRWRVRVPGPAVPILNKVPVQPGDYLIPNARGEFALRGGGLEVDGAFPAAQRPADLDAGSIVNIGQILDGLTATRWSDWLDVPPLVPGMSERAQLQLFEYRIVELLPALEAVCHRPRAHIQVQVERVAAARARRLPPQSLSYLASHTEDWEHPTLSGVRPRRVLALLPEEQLDIYENRVAARLVDHLHTYLLRRIHEVQRLHRIFQQALDYGNDAAAGSHWRQRRIFALWGRSMDADREAHLSLRTLKKLEQLNLKVAGLKDSPLYRGVPRRAQVGSTLTQTNILASDALYGRVAQLWLLWARHGYPQPRSAAKLYDDQQALCRGSICFTVLLLVHALSQLRYKPVEEYRETRICTGVTLLLDGPDGQVELRWGDDNAICLLSSSGQSLLRIVAVPAMLQSLLATQPADVGEVLDALPDRTLLLYPATPEGGTGGGAPPSFSRLYTVGNERSAGKVGRGCLPVSPWDIASAERIARALRWVLLGPRLKSYPPRAERTKEAARIADGGTWLASSNDGKQWSVLRPPRTAEWSRLGLEKAYRDAEKRVAELRQYVEGVQGDRRGARDDQRELSALNQEKRIRQQELRKEEAIEEELYRSKAEIDQAVQAIRTLLICPICSQTEPEPYRGFEVREDSFLCRCASCNASWGKHTCFHCRESFPFLWPDVELPVDPQGGRSPGWVDAHVGCDALAVPCPRPHGPKPSFLCPSCGNCPACQE